MPSTRLSRLRNRARALLQARCQTGLSSRRLHFQSVGRRAMQEACQSLQLKMKHRTQNPRIDQHLRKPNLHVLGSSFAWAHSLTCMGACLCICSVSFLLSLLFALGFATNEPPISPPPTTSVMTSYERGGRAHG
jgi:hypothetical protein